jgi:hypothetical protein
MRVHICRNSWRQKVIKKEAEKVLKYKNLIIETECMWNVKENGILVITGWNGTFQNHSNIT